MEPSAKEGESKSPLIQDERQSSSFPENSIARKPRFLSLKTVFLFNGIISMLALNATYNSLDYFAWKYSHYNVYLYMPIPLNISFFIISLTYEWINIKLGVRKIIIGGIIGTIAMLSLLILSSLLI